MAACNLTENDVVVGVAPFFHVTGSVGHLAVAALLGIPVILFFRFEPGEVLRLLEKWRVTIIKNKPYLLIKRRTKRFYFENNHYPEKSAFPAVRLLLQP